MNVHIGHFQELLFHVFATARPFIAQLEKPCLAATKSTNTAGFQPPLLLN